MRDADAYYRSYFVVGCYCTSPRSCCKLSDVRRGVAASRVLCAFLRFCVVAVAGVAASGVAVVAVVGNAVATVAAMASPVWESRARLTRLAAFAW